MTDTIEIAEWQAFIESVSIAGTIPVALELELDYFSHGIGMRFLAWVVDRDNQTREIKIQKVVRVPDLARCDKARWLRAEVQSLYVHEADENIIIDGRRVFDPHDRKST